MYASLLFLPNHIHMEIKTLSSVSMRIGDTIKDTCTTKQYGVDLMQAVKRAKLLLLKSCFISELSVKNREVEISLESLYALSLSFESFRYNDMEKLEMVNFAESAKSLKSNVQDCTKSLETLQEGLNSNRKRSGENDKGFTLKKLIQENNAAKKQKFIEQ